MVLLKEVSLLFIRLCERELAFLGDNCCLSDNLVQATLPRSDSPWRCLSVEEVLLETRLICHVYPTWSAQPDRGLGYGPV